MTATQLLPALLRTIVPLIYGLLIQLGLGRYLPDETVTTVATVILLAGIYLVLRLLEHLQPKIGILLGWAKQPQYADVVQGEVLNAQDLVETVTKDDLRELGDQLLAAVETKATAKDVSAAVGKAINASSRKGK